MNKRPPFLKAGDKIGIVAPARKFTPDELAFLSEPGSGF